MVFGFVVRQRLYHLDVVDVVGGSWLDRGLIAKDYFVPVLALKETGLLVWMFEYGYLYPFYSIVLFCDQCW